MAALANEQEFYNRLTERGIRTMDREHLADLWRSYLSATRSIELWLEHGADPGDQTTAMLCNDLRGAFERADHNRSLVIPLVLEFIYWDVPGNAWGSAQKFRDYTRYVREARRESN